MATNQKIKNDDDPWGEYPAIERRSNSHREQLRHAVVEGIEEFLTDESRVRKSVHVIVEAIQEELSSGAGKVIFRGARRVLWFIVIALMVLGLGGWTALVAFVKGVLVHG